MVKKTDELSNEDGKNIGAIDLQSSELIDYVIKNKRNFDFGISAKKNWRIHNIGLINQIEDFGVHAVFYDKFKMAVR